MNSLSLNLKRVTCNTLTALAVTGNRYSIREQSSASSSSSTTTTSSTLYTQTKRLNSSIIADAAEVNTTVCPHLAYNVTESMSTIHHTAEWQNALPYHEIPGPKPIPILGNTWRYFFLFIYDYELILFIYLFI